MGCLSRKALSLLPILSTLLLTGDRLSVVNAIPENPVVTPTSGFAPLTIFINTEFPDNDTEASLVFTIDSPATNVRCDASRGERKIAAPFASMVQFSSILLRVRVCHELEGDSLISVVDVSVNAWIGLSPLITAYIIILVAVFVMAAVMTKAKLRGNFVTWYASLSALPILTFGTYIFGALDFILTYSQPSQSNNLIYGIVIIVFLLLSGCFNIFFALKIYKQQYEDDRKMDWWRNNNRSSSRSIMFMTFFGFGFFTIIFSRLLDKDLLNAGCDTTNATFDLQRRVDRLAGVNLLLGELVVVVVCLIAVSASDPVDIVPTSAFTVLVVAILSLVLNGVRVMFGMVNRTPLDPKNRGSKFKGAQGNAMFLKMKAVKGAEEGGGEEEGKGDGEEGAGAGAGGPPGENKVAPSGPPKKETRAQRRARLAYEARLKRPKFDPFNYSRKLKYGRNLPDFADMT